PRRAGSSAAGSSTARPSTARSGLRDRLLGRPPIRRSGPPRVGLFADALRDRWFELSLAVAACAAVGAGRLIIAVIGPLGGFVLLPVETGIVTRGHVAGHLSMTLQDTVNLFGA